MAKAPVADKNAIMLDQWRLAHPTLAEQRENFVVTEFVAY
jgi:hypothetical protein